MAESNGLLNRRTGNTVPGVRIPPSPPSKKQGAAITLRLFLLPRETGIHAGELKAKPAGGAAAGTPGFDREPRRGEQSRSEAKAIPPSPPFL